ncbi:MAG: hypothetical protein WBA57_05735 [Elainellaceae cyanobacterium]
MRNTTLIYLPIPYSSKFEELVLETNRVMTRAARDSCSELFLTIEILENRDRPLAIAHHQQAD